ncbi:thermonuclease family protein [Blastococcus sp. SYSU DS0539]
MSSSSKESTLAKLLAVASAHKAATAVAVAAVVAGGGIVHAATDDTTTATVTKVVDGDTIDVRYDGDTHRVRLLNVDTPESVDPDQPVECLGPEATAWLEQRLPVGTDVRLERDEEVQDKYGRELAAVFLGEQLVNAEIARAGLGYAMSVGGNTKYFPPVQAAEAEARVAGRGLYSAEVACTIPAQVEQLQESATEAVDQAPSATADLADFDAHAAELAVVASSARTLIHLFDGDIDAFPLVAHGGGHVAVYRALVEAVESRVERATSANSTARQARERQLAAEARRAAEEAARKAAEEARIAAEEAARQAAEEAERAAAAAAARAAERSSSGSGSTSRSPGTSGTPRTTAPPPPARSDFDPSTYTGCRSYAPGGKTWSPIPC